MAPLTTPNPHERRAQALAEIAQMQEQIVASHTRIEELERALLMRGDELTARCNRLGDQLEAMKEERDRYRAQSELFQRTLIELATVQANIGLLTERSKGVMMTVNEVMGDRSAEHSQREQESARDIIQTVQKIEPPHVPQISAPIKSETVEDLEHNIREMFGRNR